MLSGFYLFINPFITNNIKGTYMMANNLALNRIVNM